MFNLRIICQYRTVSRAFFLELIYICIRNFRRILQKSKSDFSSCAENHSNSSDKLNFDTKQAEGTLLAQLEKAS